LRATAFCEALCSSREAVARRARSYNVRLASSCIARRARSCNVRPASSCIARGARSYWQASQYSGFSSEQNTAALASSCASTTGAVGAGTDDDELTVVFAMRVAGRERR